MLPPMSPHPWLIYLLAFALGLSAAAAEPERAGGQSVREVIPAGTNLNKAVEELSRHSDVIAVANSMQADPAALAAQALNGKAFMESKNVEIRFYGKVVDQNEQPLTGVAVQGHTREWRMKNPFEPEGKFMNPVALTGADGLFSFTRLYGDSFQIHSIKKDGYIISKSAKLGYSYGPLAHFYQPNPLAPEIFHMWKTNGAVPLYVVNISMSIPQDGTVLAFDLRRNRRVTLPGEDTDLRITLDQHAPPGQRNARVPFDWSFVLEVPDGGVIETRDEFMYLAPEQGYQPKWVAEYPKDAPNWKARREVDFYLHNRAGQQYGRLAVSFKVSAGYPTGYLTVLGYLNPVGRVLEYDGRLKLQPELINQPKPQFGAPNPAPAVNSPPANGAVSSPPPSSPPPGSPAPPPFGAPNLPQPPPGFQALTNRGKALPPPVPVR
ncbi:MAG: hypothetical protein EBY09_20185, partial [Verrucomicrobia bacterium]|nr:hypothetical protein [Verrucomicrobiota bacterium]NDF00972.1 hypothetical protein [Verrucomicrobiota bacterium]